MDRFLLPEKPITSLDQYLATDVGGLGLQRAVDVGPRATIDEVTRAGLRGRGGGGFPTGTKWASVLSQPGARRFVVCNAPRASPEPSRTGPSCGPIPISWWRGC